MSDGSPVLAVRAARPDPARIRPPVPGLGYRHNTPSARTGVEDLGPYPWSIWDRTLVAASTARQFMGLFWGLTFGALALLAWGGQVITWLAPDVAVRFGVTEAKETVDPAFWADVRGEAMWDSLTLWTGVVAGVLLILDRAAWPFFGLVAGSSYLYFGGRGLSTRREMQRLHIRYGSPSNVAAARTLLSVWAVAGAITIAAAVVALG